MTKQIKKKSHTAAFKFKVAVAGFVRQGTNFSILIMKF
jgi:hypothetical protein